MRVARAFPSVKFEVLTGYKLAPNVATANARYYEGRYLAGVAAGRMSKSPTVGYVAGFPIPEVLQGINAFALGLRSVNPKAQVRVIWLNEWFNPPRERDAAMTLMNQGADVLAFHTGSTAVIAAAEERGWKVSEEKTAWYIEQLKANKMKVQPAPEALQAHIEREITRWAAVVKSTGAKVD